MSSTPKEIIFEEQARELLLSGIRQIADVVAFTIGPRGKNVGLEKSYGAPTITNDGSSIVKDVSLKDTYENMGVSMAKEVVQKIKEKCGDGTSTGILLLRALAENGIKLVASGASPIGIKRGIEKAVDAVVKEIEKNAIAVKDQNEIRNVAIVSASGNEDIGNTIAEAMEKVGKNGVITIKEGKSTETKIEIVEGMQLDRGYISAYFSTNAEKMTAELLSPYILLLDKKINSVHDILSILQQVATTGKELLIIADDIEGDTLSTLVVNKLRGSLKVCAIKAPGFGDRKKALLQDIAILTGGTVISDDMGLSTSEISLDSLGTAESVTVSKDHTLIMNGGGNKAAIESRVKQIESEIQETKSPYDIEKLEERKAKLAGGIAVIEVGAATTPELKQRKQMFEDSLNSTKAAMEDGVVPGGGVALLRASLVLDNLKLEGDEALGVTIVKNACRAPIKQIAVNAGEDGAVILQEVLKQGSSFGFNAVSGKIEDLLKAGVIDPAKVEKYALIYAASVAEIVIITEALIADAPEDESKSA